LGEGGVDHAIEIVDWTAGHNVLEDQTNLDRNRQIARQSSQRIARYVAQYPGRPVHLVGISAGTGIVVFAVEQLPPGVQVDGLILMASSLTNTYDLSPAMNRVRNDITNFSSVADVGVLGVGVGLAGTVDRGSGPAAGLYGFGLPDGASPQIEALYKEKLVEVPWKPTYVVYGHVGDHLGAASAGFVRRFVAPIVLDASRLRGDQNAATAVAADQPSASHGDSPTP
jgi:pimeloyl-ACP methyl ester carboxylesterase